MRSNEKEADRITYSRLHRMLGVRSLAGCRYESQTIHDLDKLIDNISEFPYRRVYFTFGYVTRCSFETFRKRSEFVGSGAGHAECKPTV
jgi:hypothetical protein